MTASRPARFDTAAAVAAVVLWLAADAQAILTDLALRGDSDTLWLLRTDAAADSETITTVRRRADALAGTWVDAGRFAGRFADAAVLDGRLAILADNGAWRLMWEGHSIDGPAADGRIRRIAADGRTLWAVVLSVRADASPRLCAWDEAGGWRTIAPLPDGAGTSATAIGVVAGVQWLAWVDGDGVRAARWTGREWSASSQRFGPGQTVEFVTGSPWPLVLVGRDDGRQALWRPDTSPPTLVRESLGLPRPTGYAMVGPMLRAVFRLEDKLRQSTFDDYGRGRMSGPTRLPEPGAVAPRPFELIHLVLLAVLTSAMLRAIRQPETLPTLPTNLRVAPLGRRAAAAVVDALPVVAAAVWAFSRFDGSVEHLRQQSERVFFPIFAGGLVYLIHVTVSEAVFGKSIGKWLFGLRVVTLTGERPRVESVFVRNLMRSLDAFVLPALLPLVSPGARRVGDLAAGTVVVVDAPTPGAPG